MLPNLSKQYNIKDLSIDISPKVLGKRISIKNKSNLVFNDKILNYYKTIHNIEFDPVFEVTQKLMKTLNFKNYEEDISDLIPQSILGESISKFKSHVIGNSINDYFFNIIEKRYQLTESIEESKYDHISSVTGRMKITDGKNYLVMKKEKRKELSVRKGNRLLEIDIKSCEPALLHAVLYNETPDDIYNFFGKDLPRSKTKIAVISSIYGAEPKRVKRITGLPITEIKRIHDHFQLNKIKESIESTFKRQGYFRNLYGRPIKDISSPVNYWVQSSAADYACLAFLNLIKRGNFKIKASIHDAVILDLSPKQYSLVKNIEKIYDPISNIKLRVEHSLIK